MSTGAPALVTSQKKERVPAPGPPFAAGSAINGLSLNGAGQIVLGNDFPGLAAVLLNDREIPFAGNILHATNAAGVLLFDPPQIRAQNTANTISSVFEPGQIAINSNSLVFPPNLSFGTALAAQTMNMVNNAGALNVKDFAGNLYLMIDPQAHTFQMGDINGANLANFLFVDDGFFGDESLGYTSGGVTWLNTGPGANGFIIGDQSLTTGVLLTGDNTNNRLRFQNSAGRYLDLTAGGIRQYSIGQITGGNGSFLNIDDINQLFKFNKEVTIGRTIPTAVNHSLNIRAEGNGAFDGFYLENLGATDFVQIGAGGMRSTTTLDLRSFINSVTVSPSLTLTATFTTTGLGVGIAVPTERIEANGNILASNGAGNGVRIHGTNHTIDSVNSSTPLTLQSTGGTVGIGMFGAAFALDVAGSVNILGTTGNTFRWNAASTAPGTTATPVFTSFYGGNTIAMGDPVGWILVNVAGTDRKIPFY